jgi:hypothetical protein
MPMPASATESVIHSRPFSCPWRAAMVTGALFGELVGVAHEVQQCLPEPHLIRPA